MKYYKDPGATAKMVLFGATLMIFIHMFVLGGLTPPKSSHIETMNSELLTGSEIEDYESARTIMEDKMGPPRNQLSDQVFLHLPQPDPVYNQPAEKEKPKPKLYKQSWKKNAVQITAPPGKGRIVIIIDDMGMDRKHSYEAINIDAPLTLAFLPYAPALDEITADARKKGHELLIHAPMEPLKSDLNPGPLALLNDMSAADIRTELDKILDSFEGYVGINNHMGSKLTQNKAAMNLVMEMLAERGLIFVDSKTIHTSVAASTAAEHKIDYAERDIFLDHEDTPEFVWGALRKLEATASERGFAIAIGHPKASTLNALQEWIPTLQERGFMIVPVSTVVTSPSSVSSAALQETTVQ